MKRAISLMVMVFSLSFLIACQSQREEAGEAREELREEAQEFREEKVEEPREATKELKEEAQEFSEEQREAVNAPLNDEMKRPTGSRAEKQVDDERRGEFMGEIVEVQGDHIMIKDEAGTVHSFAISTSQNSDEFRVNLPEAGDKVLVRFGEGGKEYSIHKLEDD